MGGLSVWHWAIFTAIVLVPLIMVVWLWRHERGESYKSLRIISRTVNFLIVMGFVGRPFLEYSKKHGWQYDAIPSWLIVPLGLFFLVCVYVGVGATAYYFFRAMRNVNYLTHNHLLRPSSAWLTLVPVVNIFAMPYVWGRTYYSSLALHPMHGVRKLGAVSMSVGAFVLAFIGLATGNMSDRREFWPPGYDGLSLAIIATCTSTAGAMLFTRLVQRVSAAQELYATRVGLVPAGSHGSASTLNAGILDLLKSAAIVGCLGVALASTIWPALVSSGIDRLHDALWGQAVRLEEKARSSPTDPLEAAAAEINKAVPQQVDQVTRLDGARVEGARFVYDYTLMLDQLSEDDRSNLYRHVRSNAVPAFCQGGMKGFRQLNAIVVYRYSLNGKPGFEIAVAERDCS